MSDLQTSLEDLDYRVETLEDDMPLGGVSDLESRVSDLELTVDDICTELDLYC